MASKLTMLFVFTILAVYIPKSTGHGNMVNPLNRASLWRDPTYDGSGVPANWNDRELYCGGYMTQWWSNGGQCGACGDNWQQSSPRQHENTGTFGKGVITARYSAGQVIDIDIFLEAAHDGFFEFKICSLSTPTSIETNECFAHVLQRADGGGPQIPVNNGMAGRVNNMKYVLPPGLTCSRCVLQWRYYTGNWWGTCPDGSEALGCGPQEEFRNCADIVIS